MNKGLGVAVVFFVMASLFLSVFVQLKTTEYLDARSISARAVDGQVMICINGPPSVNVTCPHFQINQSTVLEDNTAYCTVTATDTFDNISDYFVYIPVQNGLTADVDNLGQLTIWANHSGVGSYIAQVYAEDNSPCPANGTANYSFTILGINDPPYFNGPINNIQMSAGSSLRPFYLSSYFGDLENDPLSYEVFGNNNLVIAITSGSQVIITSPATNCDDELVFFRATDTGGLSTDSNVIEIASSCSTETSSGGGGGGSSGCDPEWICRDWSRCYINGTREKECYDKNGCNINHLTTTFWEECEYLPTCFDGIRNQGEEGIDCGGPCNACEQLPEDKTVEPSCSDGIQNQGETGIDCGGPCPVCRQIEVPALIVEDEENNILSVAVITGLLAAIFSIIYILFRKEIKTIIAKIGWWLTGKKRKLILLEDEKKKEFLEKIKGLENKIISTNEDIFNPDNSLLKEMLRLNRTYLEVLLAISAESSPEELELKLIKRITNIPFRQAIKLFIKKLSVSEKKLPNMTKKQVLLQIQELRQLVLNTSNYDKKDYDFLAVQMPVEGKSIDKMFSLLYNSMLALEFIEVESAKKSYLEMLKIYELLDENGKALVYDELTKLYYYTRYVLSWSDGV